MTAEERFAYCRSNKGLRAAREILSGYGRLDAEIAVKLSRIDRAREQAKRLAALPDRAKAQEASRCLAELEKELLRDYAALTERQKEIEKIIGQVPNERARTVLEMRYLAQQPFFRIAMRMHYDERQIYRYHRQGLQYAALLTAPSPDKK